MKPHYISLSLIIAHIEVLSTLFFALGPWYDSPNMADDLITKDDLMAYLRISRATVGRLMERGLPYIKLERRVLFRKADVDAFLEVRIIKKNPGGNK